MPLSGSEGLRRFLVRERLRTTLVMATNCTAGEFSYPPKIADLFHSFAHLNFDLNNVSSVFVPTLSDYQQVLILYAAGPCLFGGLAFLIFCVHFIASWCSCDKQHRPTQKCVIALRCIVFLLSVLFSGFVIAAFVFNDSADQGVKGVLKAVDNVNKTLTEIQSKISSIKDDLVDLDSNIIDVKSCTGILPAAQDLIDKLRRYIGDILSTVVKIKKVNLPPIEEYIQDIEYYRWWSTFGTLCLSTLTCLLMIYAVLRGSRCGFVLAMILGTFSLLLVWSGAGIDLAVAVGMSDLCVNPKATVYYYIRDQPALKNTGILRYYMECPRGVPNPYQKYADKAQGGLETALSLFSALMNLGLNLTLECQNELTRCNKELNDTQTSMSVITKNLDCKYAHQQFQSAHCFVCDGVVLGMAELLLVTLIIGVLLIIDLALVLPVYLRIPKHRKRRSILGMCGSDSPIGTPYQSISEENNQVETVPLIPNTPPPSTYDSMNHRSSIEFHSCEESGISGHYNRGVLHSRDSFSNITNPSAPPTHPASSSAVNAALSNPTIPSTRGQITSMAF